MWHSARYLRKQDGERSDTMHISKLTVMAGMTLPLFLASCSAASTERLPNSDSPTTDNGGGQLEGNAARAKPVEAAPTPASMPTVTASPSGNATAEAVRVPEDVLRSPADLMMLMQQMRSQIVYKTMTIPEARYERVVRPSIASQLLAAGFTQADIDEILSDVDYSRSLQGLH
jgi:hypothetical protein